MKRTEPSAISQTVQRLERADKPRIKEVPAYNETCRAFEIFYLGKKYNTELRIGRAWIRLKKTLEALERNPADGVWGVWD